MATRYALRGVSSQKEEVHAAVRKLSRGRLFPGAFCKVIPDIAHDPAFCFATHSDGSGSKSALAYLAWRCANFPVSLFRGIAQDSLVMNIDDLACIGAIDEPFYITQTINRNKFLIPGNVLEELMLGCKQFCDEMNSLGFKLIYCGGETADLADNVRTLTIDNAVSVRVRRNRIVNANRMQPGDCIVGFSSTGQATWEKVENSGIGSNGLTNARHDLLWSGYKVATETFAPEIPMKEVYRGKYTLRDYLLGTTQHIGEALLSPTRTYLPLIKKLMRWVGPEHLHGLIHCSGGGQTKIGHFGKKNCYVKNMLFPLPPLFAQLQNASGLSWREMYETYNMGHRLEAIVPKQWVDKCIQSAEACGIEAQEVGFVMKSHSSQNEVFINSPYGAFTYTF